ncbi:MAG TPA: hypothetical protein DCX95_06625 [Elusimicrobia bacterium]|nr:hypothetical protein [Elusimicrobiota bacterium]
MKKNLYFFLLPTFYLLLTVFTGCSLYRPKQKVCKVIYSEKLPVSLKSVAVFPVKIGFPTASATEFIPLVKSPLVIENKSVDWLGRREEKMLIDFETAEKISNITSEHFYTILLKKKKYRRIVHPDSVRNVIWNKKIKLGNFKRVNDLNEPETLEKLQVISDELKVDGLLISVIKKCETIIINKNVKSTGREGFGEYQKSMGYSYKFELESGLFAASEKKIVWLGESKETKSNRTPELEQNILVAFATNGLEKFFRKYLTEKILREEPEYQCVLKIINTLPF